jgi:hypothetical protein
MASKTGSNTSIGVALSATSNTYGTAITLTDKLIVESLSYNENPDELSSNSIGSGGLLASDSVRGKVSPTVDIEMIAGFQNGMPKLLSQMLGTAGAPTEQTTGQGDYKHTIAFHDTANRVFNTIALEASSTAVTEFPSVTINNFNFTAEDPSNYCKATFSGMANEVLFSGTTATNASLQALAVADSEKTIVRTTDEFWINTASGGALSSSDRVDITSFVLDLSRPAEFKPEIRGASGNTKPVVSGLVEGTITVVLKEHVDNAWELIAQAGTEYKASFTVEGTQIGTGVNKSFACYFPRLLLLETPDYGLSDPNINPTTLTFKILEASSNPTGMGDTKPYFEIINARSTAYVA